jgi:hypothetical protein
MSMKNPFPFGLESIPEVQLIKTWRLDEETNPRAVALFVTECGSID